LRPLAKLNPLEIAVLDLLAQLVDEYLDVMAVEVVMANQELCCTTELAFHFHPTLSW
jgi:hypothetical protein